MDTSTKNYTLALKELGREREAVAEVEGYEEFKKINTIIAITERASRSISERIGRDVSLAPTIAAYAAIAEGEKPYRALFAIEGEGGITYRGMEWDRFPLTGEGAKEFFGGDYFVILVTKDREQFIEYAAVGEEAEKMEEAIEGLWNGIITAHFNGEQVEPITPTRDCRVKATLDTEVQELAGTGFTDGTMTLVYDDTKERGWLLHYTAEVLPEEETEWPI